MPRGRSLLTDASSHCGVALLQAVRLIADLQVPPFHARKVFVEESHRTNFDFVDRSGFRTVSACAVPRAVRCCP